MSYPINPNIPNANNDPADDQPVMQQNFANINSYLQVDHTNPAQNPGAGDHKQVTFFSPNPPTSPVSPPVLFTSTTDGFGTNLPGSPINPELFFWSGSAPSAQNQCKVGPGTSGSMMLFGGIIMKWGALTGIVDGATITFASAFPNNVFAIVVGGGIPGSPQPTINFNQASITNSNFVAKITGIQPINYHYIAIGN